MLDYSFNIFSSCKKYFCFRFPDQPYFLPLTLAFFIEEKEHTPKRLQFPDQKHVSLTHHIFTVNIVKKHDWTVHLETYKLFSFDVETSSHYLYIKGLYEILVLAGQFLWWSSTKYVFCVDRKSKIATTTTKHLKGSYEKMTILFIRN